MTVIYSNFGDIDTIYAHLIWENVPNANIIEITPDMIDSYEDIVNNALRQEEDTLVLFGHGTAYGLLFPDLNSGIYLVHDNNVNLIHAKSLVCIWCHASLFAMRHPEIHGFFTGMYISNINEAYDNMIYDTNQKTITAMERTFLSRINYFILNKVPIDQWTMNLGARMDITEPVEIFNYQGFYYV